MNGSRLKKIIFRIRMSNLDAIHSYKSRLMNKNFKMNKKLNFTSSEQFLNLFK